MFLINRIIIIKHLYMYIVAICQYEYLNMSDFFSWRGNWQKPLAHEKCAINVVRNISQKVRPGCHHSLLSLTPRDWSCSSETPRVWPHNVIESPKTRGVSDPHTVWTERPVSVWHRIQHVVGFYSRSRSLLDAMPKELQLAGSGLHLGQLHVCVCVCDNGSPSGKTRENLKGA